MSNHPATHYLEVLAGPSWKKENFLFLALDDKKGNLPPKTLYGTFDQWKLKLERLNQEGYGIFVTVNKTGRSRKAEDLEEIRAVWLDYDNKDVPLPEDEEWPVQPHIKVETSPGRFQLIWRTEDMPRDVHSRICNWLATKYGGDLNACDVTRTLRSPGFKHNKGEPVPVELPIFDPDTPPYKAEQLIQAFGVPAAALPPAAVPVPVGKPIKDLQRVKAALEQLDPDMEHNKWIQVGMALHDVSAGGQEGLDLWDQWSAKGTKYKQGEPATRWKSFRGGGGITIATIFKMALAAQPKPVPVPVVGRKTQCFLGEIMVRPKQSDWLVKGWIERLQSVVLWGDSQSYKSLLAMDLACCITTGTPWRRHSVKQGAVLYIAGEGAGLGLVKRFTAWQIANGVSLAGAPLIVREASTLLPTDTAAVMEDTDAMLQESGLKLELVILDTLARTMAGDENSQKDYSAYQQAIDTIKDKFQCAAMILHHCGHSDQTRARGSSAIRANTDVELSMHRMGGEKRSTLHAIKVKDAEASSDMVFDLSVVELGYEDEDGIPQTSVVLRYMEDYKAPPAPLGKHEQTIRGILEGHGPMPVGDLRKMFQKGLMEANPETSANNVRCTWKRAKNNLLDKSIIFIGDDEIVALS